MFYFIIAFIAFILFTVFVYNDTASVLFSIFDGLFVSLVVFFASILIGCYCTSSYNTLDPTTQNIVYEESIPLVALKDNMNVSGSVFIFSTAVNEELKYNYIIETEFGKTIDEVGADICFIRYGDTANIQKLHNESKSKIVNWLFMPKRSFYIITLPEGSVIENEYEVDLE